MTRNEIPKTATKRKVILEIPDDVICFTLTVKGYDCFSSHGRYERPPVWHHVEQEVLPEWFKVVKR